MKLLKTTLILLLIVVVVLYGATVINQRLSGKNVRPDISCPEEILEVSVYDPEIVLTKDVTASTSESLTKQPCTRMGLPAPMGA